MNSRFCKSCFILLGVIPFALVSTLSLHSQNPHSSHEMSIPTPVTQNSAVIHRTLHRRNIPPVMQLPNGPPQRFQRHRGSATSSVQQTRQPIGTQFEHQRYDDTRQFRQKDTSPGVQSLSNKKPYGSPQKFCNMFGCDCVPPANKKCCTGYRYDRRSKKCKELF